MSERDRDLMVTGLAVEFGGDELVVARGKILKSDRSGFVMFLVGIVVDQKSEDGLALFGR